jgi:AraC-like DNA-binding protein
MSLFESLRLIKSLSILLLIIFSVFLFTLKKERNRGSLFLASFMAARAFMLISFVSWDYFIVWKAPYLAVMAAPFLYLYCPLLYLYTKAQTNPQYIFKKVEWLHFLPAAIIMLWYLLYFIIRPFDVKIDMIKTGTVFYPVISWKIWMWLQLLIYGPLCIYLLNRYVIDIKNYQSSINEKVISWLSFLIYAFLLWKVIFLSYYLASFITGNNHLIFQIIVEIFFLFYAIGIIYFSLRFPEIHFRHEEKPKYKTSPLTIENKQVLKASIDKFMKKEKPFLDPGFDLAQLSAATSIPMHHLSQMFSEVFNQNFYDYCNKCRIEEILDLMADPHNFKKTILELMFIAGFNSKSVFNSSFKKFIGITPREYKRNIVAKIIASELN